MAHYGTLQDFRFSDPQAASEDIRGAHVYGRNDDKLGKIDDVIFDHSSGAIRYIVVDTGGWLASHKFLVPPQQLGQSARHKGDFTIDLDKKQIESFPPYRAADIASEDRWRDYEDRYQAAWMNGPVQHRKGSDHNVTPTASEMPPEPGSIGSQISEEENRRLSERIIPAGTDEVTIQDSGAGIGPRWLTFESRLRQHRRDLTTSCPSCTVGPVSDRGDESAADERKSV
jgi:sporulation protein YlmC with PRC-barrel domain